MSKGHFSSTAGQTGWLARKPRIVRLYVMHSVLGFMIAGFLTAVILWTNTMNIATLASNVEGGWLAVVIFFMLNGLVFAGAQSGIAIMLMTESDNSGSGRGTGALTHDHAVVPVRVSRD